jgi:hypothetical protein
MSHPDFTADVIFVSDLEQNRTPPVTDPEPKVTNANDLNIKVESKDSDLCDFDFRPTHKIKRGAWSRTGPNTFHAGHSKPDGSNHNRVEVIILAL